MPAREDAYQRNQQSRWLRPDGHRWLRPDAARFLKPGAEGTKTFPVPNRKYSPSQRRVPAGRSDGGQWTSGNANSGGNNQPQRTGSIDFGDPSELSDLSGLFEIAPSDFDLGDLTQFAGDIPPGDSPGIGHNDGPPLEPPEVPETRPSMPTARMDIVWKVTEWMGAIGRQSPLIGVFFQANEQAEWFKNYIDITKTYHDPPQTLDELQARVNLPSEPGYQDHHIEEQGTLGNLGYVRADIDNPDNIVRIPTLKHFEITAWYATRNPEFGNILPREYLASQPQKVRRQTGLDALVRMGVLKP